MAVSKQPSITPETSSGEGLDEEPTSRGEAKWKRFHPFRVVRKIFRRRVKREGTTVVSDASKKSWSTSELQTVQDDTPGKCEVTSPLKIGLSVSHDSIFSPESNASVLNSEELNVPRGSSLSVRHTSIKNMFKDELFTRVRARRDSDDDDIGLPHSPCTSPTTVDVLTQGLKEKSSKSQTTCSAGSLISMGSSENDEDSAGHSSGHSSRMSLLDRRSLDSDGDLDLSQPVPLNHNAAHHKIAVRPKRTYGLPRRRMNQIAAAKVNALPSTPEVLEDNGKSFQTLDISELQKSFSEISSSSVSETASVFSGERKTSQISSSFCYNESFQVTSETIIHEERSLLDSSFQSLKINSEDDQEWHVKETPNKLNKDTTAALEVQEDKTDDINSVESDSFSCTNKITSETPCDLMQNLEEKHTATNKNDSFRLSKSNFEESSKNEFLHSEDCTLTRNEPVLSVSSLVKSIERSNSFKTAEKVRSSLEESKHLFTKNYAHEQTDFSSEKKSVAETDEMKSKCDTLMEDILVSSSEIANKHENISPSQELKGQRLMTSQKFISETFKKTVTENLDIESEFVLKPPRKETKLDSDLESVSKENIEDEGHKENSIISSRNLEEESIMSSKSVSMGIEESRIFVSHHTTFNDDLKDILVTEAHNFAAVEEKSGVSVQTCSDAGTMNAEKASVKQEKCETWISSVGISAPTSSITDVTVSASTSTLCDNRMLEDKITISVNSKSDNMKCKYTNQKDDIAKLPLSDTLKSTSTNLNASQKAIPKDKQALKAVQKSHLPEVNSNMTSVKNGNIQKRVSVEIVPFSQRMKERKYQPISFANRENSSELNKKNSNVLVERKLSDRKMTTKNKELDKSNNRHSFSGSLTSDIKKEVEPNLGKKVSKPEKLPVQIRIHKSIPKSEIKDKVCNDIINSKEVKNTSETDTSGEIKFKMHSTKINQNDLKFMKEEKKTYDNSTKWDIKIQPASTLANVSSYISNSEGNISPVMPQNNLQLRNESPKPPQLSESECKDFQFNEESESQIKSQENSWRQQKEVPTLITDDPEPELLRVFARRSIKQKHNDKGRPDEKDEKLITDTSSEDSFHLQEENTEMISVCQNSTVIKISEVSKPHITKPDLKKKSKSFCEKGKVTPRSVSPLKEINLIRRESPLKFSPADPPSCNDTIHPRQRIASVPDVPLNLPPDNDKKNTSRIPQTESSSEIHAPLSVKEEPQQRSSSVIVPSPTTSMNGSLTSTGLVRENQEILTGKEAHAPAWLQLAQQRRELREQRERLLLGGSPNSFIDASNKPSRSSKVWDMVNNFQKLQMT